MRVKTIAIAFLILALTVVLAACGDTATPQTITLPPSTSGASGNGGGTNAGTNSNGGTNAGTGSNNGATGQNGGGTAPAPTIDPNAKVEIPTIPDASEIQVSASSLANAGGIGRFAGAANGISPTVKVYTSNDDVATLTNNVTTTLQSAGFARAGFGGGAGGFRGGANGTPGAGFNGTPRAGANGTPRAGGFNGTPRAGANGTPGAGFGGGRGGFGGGGLWTKQGDADIFFTVMQVPASGQQSNNPFFSNLDAATQQQLQGKNSVLIIIAAPGLAQNMQRGFGGGNGGAGGFGGGNGGAGANGGANNAQNTPSSAS